MRGRRTNGFTLIELLVVVAIIALLISILLPSLSCARNQARAAKCGAQLKGLGNGLTMYFNENRDWIPGVNTSGFTFWSEYTAGDVAAGLRRTKLAVQTYDWLSPILRFDTDLGANRAERWKNIIDRYQCASNAGTRIDEFYDIGFNQSADNADFVGNDWSPLSYLMPVHFQFWGRSDAATILGRAPSGVTYPARVVPASWEVVSEKFRSRVETIGNPARKVAAADGNRFLTGPGIVDFDISPTPGLFGSFTSSGAWWAGGHEYGVRTPSANWDGQTVTGGGFPEHAGKNLALSYRHGCTNGSVPQQAQDNKGSINAMFFDGHVARLGDRESRNVEFWYPKGALVKRPNEGMTTLPMDFEIP